MAKGFFSKIRNYFITGLAIMLPAFLTLVILRWFVGAVNISLLQPFVKFLEPYIGSALTLFLIKVALFFSMVVFIILCGMATKIIVVHKFFGWWENILKGTPIVNKIYNATKELSVALFRQKKGLFSRVVIIEYPRPGLFALGFVTAEKVSPSVVKKNLDDALVSVYIPTTPNPTSGVFLFVKKKDLIDTDITTEEALKLVLSGGAISSFKDKADINDTKN